MVRLECCKTTESDWSIFSRMDEDVDSIAGVARPTEKANYNPKIGYLILGD